MTDTLTDDQRQLLSNHDGTFVWKADGDQIVRIVPFHIKAYGSQKSVRASDNTPVVIVFINTGGSQLYIKSFEKDLDAQMELARIARCLMRN